MLTSKEDAEDVLQEVFAAAYNAMLADEREINVRPWLYRIARNRSLNHLRRATAVGVDSMDVHLSEGGLTTADKVHKREEFRLLIADVQDLPETQRTALLLREIDAPPTGHRRGDGDHGPVGQVPARARACLLPRPPRRGCSPATRSASSSVPSPRALRARPRPSAGTCACATLRELPQAAALRRPRDGRPVPVGPLFLLKKTILAQLGAGPPPRAARPPPARRGASAAGGALQAGMTTLATKAVAGLAAAAIVTAGAAEVERVAGKDRSKAGATTIAAVARQAPPAAAAASAPEPVGCAQPRSPPPRPAASRATEAGRQEGPESPPRRSARSTSRRCPRARVPARRPTPSSTTAT